MKLATAATWAMLVPLIAVGVRVQEAGREAAGPKTIVDLQPFRETSQLRVKGKAGQEGTVTLVNLNPRINAWYLLELTWDGGAGGTSYHLENPNPGGRKVAVEQTYPAGIVIFEGGRRYPCEISWGERPNALEKAKASAQVYSPLCDGRIYLRNAATGHRTTLEGATEFLREHVWGGENIIALGHILLGDVHREAGKTQAEGKAAGGAPAQFNDRPLAAMIDERFASQALARGSLGIATEKAAPAGLSPGAWYPAEGNPGVFVSIVQPNLIDAALFKTYTGRVNALDGTEAGSLCYSVAFDLDRFVLGYALGTEHPQVGWSAHMLASMRDPKLPGPDGIGTISPLVATGLVSPQDAPRTVATFTGGFKRAHGAFKYGDLALRNYGTHYGFLEDGVVLSKLQPGLSTMFTLDDGTFAMKTWTEADNAVLARIRHARQNGVPLIEFDAGSKAGVPGALVNRWGPGNWSGSQDMKLRTMRSGAALARNGAKRFLIYSVFTAATPSAMARVFQAYRCEYAMLLDMNALEHTYFALYRRAGSKLMVEHLIQQMKAVDKSASGEVVPRFLGYPDNRDFFYITRR